jgi:hypothetical protein
VTKQELINQALEDMLDNAFGPISEGDQDKLSELFSGVEVEYSTIIGQVFRKYAETIVTTIALFGLPSLLMMLATTFTIGYQTAKLEDSSVE